MTSASNWRRFRPSEGRTKSSAVSLQSSLKLCTRAETQICLTGELGLTTNRAGGSSNSTVRAPSWRSTSNSYCAAAFSSARSRRVSEASDFIRNCCSSSKSKFSSGVANGDAGKSQRHPDDNDDSCPGHGVVSGRIDPFLHQSLFVDQDDHKDQDERQQHAVQHLREENHLHQRELRQNDHSRADDNQQRVEPIKNRRLAPALAYARFEAEAFAN